METKEPQAPQFIPRDEWLDITTELTAELEDTRESWFEQVMEIFDTIGRQEGAIEFDPTEVVPNAETEDAMRGYQLFVSLSLAATNKYIGEEEFEDFADILCAQVCGADYYECMEYYNRFVESEDPEAMKRTLGDMTAKSFGEGGNTEGKRLDMVRDMVPLLGIMTMMVTARAFNDDERVKEYTTMFDQLVGPPEGES